MHSIELEIENKGYEVTVINLNDDKLVQVFEKGTKLPIFTAEITISQIEKILTFVKGALEPTDTRISHFAVKAMDRPQSLLYVYEHNPDITNCVLSFTGVIDASTIQYAKDETYKIVDRYKTTSLVTIKFDLRELRYTDNDGFELLMWCISKNVKLINVPQYLKERFVEAGHVFN